MFGHIPNRSAVPRGHSAGSLAWWWSLPGWVAAWLSVAERRENGQSNHEQMVCMAPEKEQSPSNHVWCHCVTIDYNITSLVTSSILKKIMRNYRPVFYCSYMKLKIKQCQIMLWWCFCMVFSEEIRYWSESGWWLISPDSAPWIHRSCSGLWPTRSASCHNGGCTEKINTIQWLTLVTRLLWIQIIFPHMILSGETGIYDC